MLSAILSCIANKKYIPSPTPVLTLSQKPDAKLDMMEEMGAETFCQIEAKLIMPGKIAGYMKKKIATELAEFRKELVAGLTRAKEAIQTMFSSKLW